MTVAFRRNAGRANGECQCRVAERLRASIMCSCFVRSNTASFSSGDQVAGLTDMLGSFCALQRRALLQQRIEAYQRRGKTLGYVDQPNELKARAGGRRTAGKLQLLRGTAGVRRVDKAFRAFFGSVRKGRPVPAKSSRHWTPSRKKNCKIHRLSAAGRLRHPRSFGSFSNCLTIPATRSIAVTFNVHSLNTYTSISGNAYTGLLCAEARYLCGVGRTDYWKPPLRALLADSPPVLLKRMGGYFDVDTGSSRKVQI